MEYGLLQVLDGLMQHRGEHEFLLVAPQVPRHLKQREFPEFSFAALGGSPHSFLWRQRQGSRFCARHSIQLWHSFVRAIPLRLSVPVVATVHEISELHAPHTADEGSLWKRKWWTRLIAKRADHLVCVSEATAQQVRTLHPNIKDRLVVIPHGVSSRFHANAEEREDENVRAFLKLPAKVPWLLFLGRPLLRKGRVRAVHAFLEACQQLPDLHLVLAGPPAPQDDGAWAIAVQGQRESQVRQTGFLPQEMVPPLLRQAGALLMPSYSEGFGLPVLEAMACGTPVISSGVGGLATTGGTAALTVDFDQPELAGEVCLQALREREDLASAGLAHAQGFPADQTARALLDLWSRILAVA